MKTHHEMTFFVETKASFFLFRLRVNVSLPLDWWFVVIGSGVYDIYIYPGIPTTLKTMGVNITTIVYLGV